MSGKPPFYLGQKEQVQSQQQLKSLKLLCHICRAGRDAGSQLLAWDRPDVSLTLAVSQNKKDLCKTMSSMVFSKPLKPWAQAGRWVEEECCRELFFKSSAAATSSGILWNQKYLFSNSRKVWFMLQLLMCFGPKLWENISNNFFKLSLWPPDVDFGSDLES